MIHVYKRGEVRSKARPTRRKWSASGLNIAVSEAGFTNLDRQVREAIGFLKLHKSALRRLAKKPGVESLTLDFGIARRKAEAQFDYFPPELLRLAGQLNIG